jgi:putative endonuclease
MPSSSRSAAPFWSIAGPSPELSTRARGVRRTGGTGQRIFIFHEINVSKTRQLFGKDGERLAERYLQQKGYKLVERNYRCRGGEVDLIVLDRKVIVFVEVKTRSDHQFGNPLEAVEMRKQRKMIQAAEFFLNEKGLHNREARFDVVGISWLGQQPTVEHIENAFELK